MATKIFGSSDDLIEFEGDVQGEAYSYHSKLIMCSDGTLLDINYRKNEKALWHIQSLIEGSLFKKIELATNENDNYSDVAYFEDGLKFVYVVHEWEIVFGKELRHKHP